MTEFFSTKERVDQLEMTARSWLKTPWMANSAAKGERGGVSCHNLPRQIYLACGAVAFNFPEIIGDPNVSRHTRVSIMAAFINDRPDFHSIDKDKLQPGDLLGLRIGYCVDHLGVVLRDGHFIHVLMHKKTSIDNISVPPWQQRILAAWRPVCGR